jgi:hypothetical protein
MVNGKRNRITGIPLGWCAVARWLGSSALMALTLRRVQVFPHMTIVYRKDAMEPSRR